MGGFPSGQRGQTVNLLAMPSKVRILLRPLGSWTKAEWFKTKTVRILLRPLHVYETIGTVHARMSDGIVCNMYAAVAELADAQDLKSCGGDIVPVRFRSAALLKSERNVEFTAFLLFFGFKMFEHL